MCLCSPSSINWYRLRLGVKCTTGAVLGMLAPFGRRLCGWRPTGVTPASFLPLVAVVQRPWSGFCHLRRYINCRCFFNKKRRRKRTTTTTTTTTFLALGDPFPGLKCFIIVLSQLRDRLYRNSHTRIRLVSKSMTFNSHYITLPDTCFFRSHYVSLNDQNYHRQHVGQKLTNSAYLYLIFMLDSFCSSPVHTADADETQLSSCVASASAVCILNSQLAHDDCRRIRSTIWKLNIAVWLREFWSKLITFFSTMTLLCPRLSPTSIA